MRFASLVVLAAAALVAPVAVAACSGASGAPDLTGAPPRSDGGGPKPIETTNPGADAAPGGDGGGPTTGDGGDASIVLAPKSLQDNRDRLLDTLATRKGLARCGLWAGLTATQKGVFLTITDLLGKRSYLTNAPPDAIRAGKDLETALDHVTKVYELRDKGGFGNGGGDNNRIFLQADAELIAAFRSVDAALPEWAASTDAAGAHAPFDATSETVNGQPRGQSHFWSADAKAKPLGRPGVEDVDDPRVVEIDIDYNIIHDSNPEGVYIPGGYGRDAYAALWTPLGVGGSPAFDYVPTTCP